MLIRGILFDLGDTLVSEADIGGKSLREAKLRKIKDADEVLSRLRQKYKLAVVTNTVTSRRAQVKLALGRVDLDHYFDAIVTSVDVGASKPDSRIYRVALSELGIRAEEAVMVGNRVDADIAGANRLGIKTILLTWSNRYRIEPMCEEERPVCTAETMRDVASIIEELDGHDEA